MSDIRKLAGIAGIAFVVIAIVAFVLPGAPPKIEDPNSEILTYLEDNRAAILVAQWLTFVSVLPAVLFFGYLITRLRTAEGDPPARTIATLATVITVGVLADAVAALFATGAFEAKHGLGEENARLLWDVSALATNAQLSALGGFGLFSGWIIVAKGGLPRWSGWIGLAAGVLGLLGSACLAADGAFAPFAPLAVFPGFAGFLIYSLALSIAFLREK